MFDWILNAPLEIMGKQGKKTISCHMKENKFQEETVAPKEKAQSKNVISRKA